MIKELLFIVFTLFTVLILAVPIGEYIAKVFKGEKTLLTPLFKPIEKLLYLLAGIEEDKEMSWETYTFSVVIFSIIGLVFLFLIQELQGHLPFNPQKLGKVPWDTALNTTVSFVTNTNWQSYAGEKTMSYLTQMLGLTVQNFFSGAVGLCVAIAFIRGFVRSTISTIGNFWVDLTRSLLYVLLPLSIVFALILSSQGVIQTLKPNVTIHTIEGNIQTIPRGPVASQVAIKFLGTNGGGFFNANAAHPFENPTPLTNFFELIALLLLPTSLPFTFGAMLNARRQGWSMYTAMMILYLVGLSLAVYSELKGNPFLTKLGIAHGISMEGKEVRFGVIPSIFFAHATTATSCGGVISMHDSLTPLAGFVLLFNMAVGEVIFGGVGVGLIGLLINAVMTMFISGLMIGRSPELLGKKLEPYEMFMSVIALLSAPIATLILSAVAISTYQGISSLGNFGPHGLSEILYAFKSTTGNNGSAFGGLNSSTLFYNLTTSIAMLIGRFTTLIPALAISGSLSQKKQIPPSSATFTTDIPLFVWLLVTVVIIIGGLTYFPALALGPILEHLLMNSGVVF